MTKEFQLNGKQRNYRAPGMRLLPREAYYAMWAEGSHFTMRDARREAAIERKALGDEPWSQAERRIRRARRALSARAVKRVERMVEYCLAKERNVDQVIAGRARQRLARAIESAHEAELVEQFETSMRRLCA